MTIEEAQLLLKFLDMHDRLETPGSWNQFEFNKIRKRLVKICWKKLYNENIDELC